MKTISLKIDDAIFVDTETILNSIKKPRNRYINEALEFYNTINKKRILAKKIQLESILVSQNSLKVLSDFEDFEYEN